MRIANAELVFEIEVKEDKPTVLIIEDPWSKTKIVEGIFSGCCGEEGDFVLSEKNMELSIEKTTEIIINPFRIDFNSKKIQSRLYSEIIDAEAVYIEEKSILQGMIIDYIDKLVQSVPYEMITNNIDLDLVRLLKMYDVRLEPQCNTLLERLVEYVKVITRLMKKKY